MAKHAASPAALPLQGPRWLAEYLGVPLGTVYQWSSQGSGPRAIRVGRHLRYRQSDVEAWLDSRYSDDSPPS